MRILDSQIISLPVYTSSGDYVGRVGRFVVDEESQQVIEYVVRAFPYIAPFCREQIVPRAAVVSISSAKMIIEDSTVRAPLSTPAAYQPND